MIEQKLDQLAEMYAQRDLATMDKQKLIDELYTPELKKQIADIEAEFSAKTDAVNENIATLEAEVKEEVKQHGSSVKGKFLNAVFTKGRVTWETKGLEGLMVAVPQLAQFRKEGDPSVSLRKV